ncbi:hypothetical protein AB6E04_00890 [Vibrio amylolyticus]|uniref:hypothetical protein n=1 Tax=Vibrio amylolyticus TaxID=2847292 RepID=UPI0035522B4B
MKCRVITGFLLTIFASSSVQAKDVHLGPQMIESVAIVNSASFGHNAGNLEVKIEGGITDLKGLNCDVNYLTTTNDGVGFDNMVSVLLAAHVSSKPVLLGVTDNPAYNAYPGRCSILYSQIQK